MLAFSLQHCCRLTDPLTRFRFNAFATLYIQYLITVSKSWLSYVLVSNKRLHSWIYISFRIIFYLSCKDSSQDLLGELQNVILHLLQQKVSELRVAFVSYFFIFYFCLFEVTFNRWPVLTHFILKIGNVHASFAAELHWCCFLSLNLISWSL